MPRPILVTLLCAALAGCNASTDGQVPPGGGDPGGDDPADDPSQGGWDDPGEDPFQDPGEDPGQDPGQDPGEDPGQDPGEDPGEDPGQDPGEDPGEDPGQVAVEGAESEPNDDAASANTVEVPSEITASLTPDDHDYYTVELDMGETVDVETIVPVAVGEDDVLVDTVVEVYAPGSDAIAFYDDDGGENRGSRVHIEPTEAGAWVIVVRGFDASIEGDYTLAVRTLEPVEPPEGGEAEPNDTSEQASAAGDLPAALSGELTAGDHDWYTFEASGAGSFTIETGPASDGDDTDTFLEAFGPDGTTSLGTDDDGADTGYWSRLSLQVEAAGTYYVQVRGYSDTATGPYALRIAAAGGAAAQ